jgi:ribosomal protein S18 acetylase RimI-like enzyme
MMKIRQAGMEDAETVAGLICDVQQLHAQALPHLFKPADDPAPFVADCRERILADPDSRVFIAEDRGKAVGYVVARVLHQPETAYTYARSVVHVDQISVRPGYQGGGYGRALIAAVVELARAEGAERVTLNSWDFNTQAHEFFYRMGFKVTNYRMDMYLKEEV